MRFGVNTEVLQTEWQNDRLTDWQIERLTVWKMKPTPINKEIELGKLL